MTTGRTTPPSRDGDWLGDGRGSYTGEGDETFTFGKNPPAGDELLALGRAGYTQGITWRDLALREQWDDALRLFHNQHIIGSKYLHDSYRNRSRLFRPKTRAVVRRGEAAVAAAFFSTQDQLEITPENESAPYGRASAAFYKSLTAFHLRKSIKWYPTVVGAYQTATVMGACFSKQYWRYELEKIGERPAKAFDETTKEQRPLFDPDPQTGLPVPRMEVVWGVKKDHPACDLLRPENVLLDPSSDFRDPINTSPGLVLLHHMPKIEVKRRMQMKDAKTEQPVWMRLEDGEIDSARVMTSDETSQAREGPERPDPHSQGRAVTDHDLIEIREMFFQWDGIDWQWFQLGDAHLLTDAAPTHERYAHCRPGERPVCMGVINFEALTVFPRSKVNLTAPIQHETNDIANLRIDALRLALQPRQKARAGRVTNPEALRRVDPGEPVWVRDMADLEWDKPPTVDAAAYAEQDRLNNDFDELAGHFSASSVMTNRKMNETVGGMNILNQGATQIGDYEIKNFATSWYQPVIEQIVRLIQRYETDMRKMTIAAEESQLAAQYGVTEISDALLEEDVVVQVNVGSGAADPAMKLDRFAKGFQVLGSIATPIVEALGPKYLWSPAFKEVAEEIFGMIGYSDCERFLEFGDPPEDKPEEGAAKGKTPEELQADMQKEQMRAEVAKNTEMLRSGTQKEIAMLRAKTEMKRAGLQGEQQMKMKMLELAQQRHMDREGRQFKQGEVESDRKFKFAMGERDRMFKRDEGDRGRAFDREETRGDQQFQRDQGVQDRMFQRQQSMSEQDHDLRTQGMSQQHESDMSEREAEMTDLAGLGRGKRPPAKKAASGPKNPPKMSPIAKRLAGGEDKPDVPARDLIMAHRQTRGDVQKLGGSVSEMGATLKEARQGMQDLVAQMSDFVRKSARTMETVQSQLEEMSKRAKAGRKIITEGGKRFVQIGDERRPITRGADGSISIG